MICRLQGAKKFAVILAFDVPVTREARDLAESMGVRIFTADIIYHLFDQFTAYLKQVREHCNTRRAVLYVMLPPVGQLELHDCTSCPERRGHTWQRGPTLHEPALCLPHARQAL